MRTLLIFTLLLSAATAAYAHDLRPTHAVIPDEKTAIIVGCAILDAYFSKEITRPYKLGCAARLSANVWTVYKKLPDDSIGGGPTLEISKVDGHVIGIYRTQ